ncbi:MAG: ABC transporter permease [Candidatus Eremiobacteraeota bacterium]|nr:ABC transporter permease [Candidatus Eremiobacteraeota bacterium]MBC5807656.1 ABC transporter permease [Candidatus Eremiobacteraeota bacterium]
MVALLWLRGLLLRRTARIMGSIAGVTLSVALMLALGSFISSSEAGMTRSAVSSVPVDWQVQTVSQTDATRAVQAHASAVERVLYAKITSLSAQSGGAVQTTSAGVAVGLNAAYQRTFPTQIRLLIGNPGGVLLAQQTAANLHANVGDKVSIGRLGLSPVSVVVNGVVDMPNSDSFFQQVGGPPAAAPPAPPDNVILLPTVVWHAVFDRQAIVHPDSVKVQLHVRLAHQLSNDPAAAYAQVHSLANNVEARLAGTAAIADNLGTRLLAVRSDSLYARVLFLFLGLPGVVLAALITVALAASGGDRRRVEQAILRMRGATASDVAGLAIAEALLVATVGIAAGFAVDALVKALLQSVGMLALSTPRSVAIFSAGAGFIVALFAILTPAWRQARAATVAAARATLPTQREALWSRMYLDIVLLAISGVAFWQVAAAGYQIVVAPEGIPESSVAYQAFIAPLFLWLGSGLLLTRLGHAWLRRSARTLSALLRPLARGLAAINAAAIARQRPRIVAGVILAVLAFSFAASSAIFNTTYNEQSRVDAELTNGSDVTLTGRTASPPGKMLNQLAAIPNVIAAQGMLHRFAYVGNDLQDLYGIDPTSVRGVTRMSNAYFGSGNAALALAQLAQKPEGILVSEETVKDYQLHEGDRLTIRLQSAKDHRYHQVGFIFLGVVREFPTAPRDSFLVANSSYVARTTGSHAAEVVLLRVNGDAAKVAAQAREIVRDLPGVKATDIGSTRRLVSSSLTAIDLRGLSLIELSFAVALLAAATGVTLLLGIADRRRMFVILWALGAKPAQLGSFFLSEGALILCCGALFGITLGIGIAAMLVKLLTGVFDPPPESLAIPWGFLMSLLVAGTVSTGLAIALADIATRRPSSADLKDL